MSHGLHPYKHVWSPGSMKGEVGRLTWIRRRERRGKFMAQGHSQFLYNMNGFLSASIGNAL